MLPICPDIMISHLFPSNMKCKTASMINNFCVTLSSSNEQSRCYAEKMSWPLNPIISREVIDVLLVWAAGGDDEVSWSLSLITVTRRWLFCSGWTTSPWPSTPAPAGTAPSSLWGSSWCPGAWPASPSQWPTWRPWRGHINTDGETSRYPGGRPVLH